MIRKQTTKILKTPTVKDVIKKATKLISNGGWTQGSYRRATDTGMQYCAVGALESSMEQLLGRIDYGVFGTAADLIYKHIPQEFHNNLVGFNDSNGRTAKEVITAFKKAAKEA